MGSSTAAIYKFSGFIGPSCDLSAMQDWVSFRRPDNGKATISLFFLKMKRYLRKVFFVQIAVGQGRNEIISVSTHLREWIAGSSPIITFGVKLGLAFFGVGFSFGLDGQFGHVEPRDHKGLLFAIFGFVSRLVFVFLFDLLAKRGDHPRTVQEISAGVAWTVPNTSFSVG
jgi:hypothetical protein